MLFLSGILFLIAAVIMKYKPPKKINSWYGYRTSLSMSSERAWNLAQKHSAKAMIRYSLLMMLIGLFSGYYLIKDKYVAQTIIFEVIIMLPLCTF